MPNAIDDIPRQVGERFQLPLAKRRRWWQFWRPKWHTVMRDYIVTAVTDSGTVAYERER